MPQIRPAAPADIPAITAIYNDAVRSTTAIWNDTLVDEAERLGWLSARQEAGLPVLVACAGGALLGYASYGPWRPHDGYRHTVEHSVYVAPEARGRGVARALMEALIAHARAAGLHVMIGAVASENAASLRLHAGLGFAEAGRCREVGAKFGRWLDLTFVQLILDDKEPPRHDLSAALSQTL